MTVFNLMTIFLIFWLYRYAGTLLYKINHAESEYDSYKIYFPSVPNLAVFIFWKLTRRNLNWKSGAAAHFRWLEKPDKKEFFQTLIIYKEIYLWPISKIIWAYNETKYIPFWKFLHKTKTEQRNTAR